MANQNDLSVGARREKIITRSPRTCRRISSPLARIASLAVPASLASALSVGPSTTVDPCLLLSPADAKTTSILTVGDLPAGNGYRMVGIPDGVSASRLHTTVASR